MRRENDAPFRIGQPERPLRVAVVGSGPSGFFAAQSLLKQHEVAVEIDIFDRLPTPYGLVRGGVAPDHQSIKAVTRIYERAALQAEFRFIGNVTVGSDVSVADLHDHYDQIVFAVGNEIDRRLGIPGEGCWRVHPSTVFVGWYNGHPDFRTATFDLSVERVAVVGNGNVAVDVARILARDPEELRQTDIAAHALASLERSEVREIHLLGRRGPLQASFTSAELAELGRLRSADPVVDPADLELDLAGQAALARAEPRVKRNFEMLEEFSRRRPTRPRRIVFRFLVAPVEIVADSESRGCALRLEHNRLVEDGEGGFEAQPTAERSNLDVGMTITAIGFQGRPLPGVPFDERRGRIRNVEGRVVDADGRRRPNQYVVGWARSGPRGLIGAHKAASAEVAELMLSDLASGTVPGRPLPRRSAILDWLRERGVRAVSFDDWKALDEIETSRGVRRGAPRDKVTDQVEMLRLMDAQNDAT